MKTRTKNIVNSVVLAVNLFAMFFLFSLFMAAKEQALAYECLIALPFIVLLYVVFNTIINGSYAAKVSSKNAKIAAENSQVLVDCCIAMQNDLATIVQLLSNQCGYVEQGGYAQQNDYYVQDNNDVHGNNAMHSSHATHNNQSNNFDQNSKAIDNHTSMSNDDHYVEDEHTVLNDGIQEESSQSVKKARKPRASKKDKE